MGGWHRSWPNLVGGHHSLLRNKTTNKNTATNNKLKKSNSKKNVYQALVVWLSPVAPVTTSELWFPRCPMAIPSGSGRELWWLVPSASNRIRTGGGGNRSWVDLRNLFTTDIAATFIDAGLPVPDEDKRGKKTGESWVWALVETPNAIEGKASYPRVLSLVRLCRVALGFLICLAQVPVFCSAQVGLLFLSLSREVAQGFLF